MKKLIFVLAYLLLAVPCGAGTITVDDDGPADFDNIQAAINDANDHDIVVVFPGTYTGFGNCCIDFLGKAITVQSTDPNDPNIVAETVISCYGTFYEFRFHTAEGPNSVLAGVTIINCSQWAAILCNNASPTITNCAITGYPPAYYSSNGIVCDYSSSPTITNCTITDNTARGIVCWDNSNPTISSCKISNNGGGIYCWYKSSLKITSCNISGNSASYEGGGIYCYSGNVLPIFEDGKSHNVTVIMG